MGRREESLFCDPGFELKLLYVEKREKRRANINGVGGKRAHADVYRLAFILLKKYENTSAASLTD